MNIKDDIRSFKGVIFDFDGTIADSMGVWYEVDQEFLSRHGLIAPPDYGKMLSTLGFERGARYVIDTFGLKLSPSSIMDEWNELALKHYSHDVELKPGARDYIEMVRDAGLPISIATTLTPTLLTAALTRNGIDTLFDALAFGDEVAHDKHEPDVYYLAARRMQVDPRSCVVFEDILPGILSARRAGMYAIAVRDDSRLQEVDALKDAADEFIDSFEDLLD